MAQTINRLTDLKVRRVSEPGAYPDGAGLYLQVSHAGAKSWFYRYEINGKGRKKGLGSFPTVTLEQARRSATQCRLLRQQGLDPIEHVRQQKKEKEIQSTRAKARTKTFRDCALDYIDSRKAEWTNAKHASQWSQTLMMYAFPHFGEIPVQEVDTPMVVNALKKIWTTKTETATRVRQRIEAILDYAKTLRYRTGGNPARWKGHLDKVLPRPTKIRVIKHHPAMQHAKAPEYFRLLREKQTVAAHALTFIMLTATRSGEARHARWPEIDLDKAVWTIPVERMKARREFRVPLTPEALTVLAETKRFSKGDWVFPGLNARGPVTEAATRKLLKQMHPGLTTHGFRSTFRDWCAETTNFPREIAESALAHVLKDKTESAYQRSDLLDRRRKLMETWEKHLLIYQEVENVVPIKGLTDTLVSRSGSPAPGLLPG